MAEGRMKKFTGEVSLTGQPFVMEPSKSVGQLLKEHNADVTGFIIRLKWAKALRKSRLTLQQKLLRYSPDFLESRLRAGFFLRLSL